MVTNFGLLWYELEESQVKKNMLYFFVGVTTLVLGQLIQALLLILLGPEFLSSPGGYIPNIMWSVGQIISVFGFKTKKAV